MKRRIFQKKDYVLAATCHSCRPDTIVRHVVTRQPSPYFWSTFHQGYTPFHLLCQNGQLQAASLQMILHTAGIPLSSLPINTPSCNGQTPLHAAIEAENFSIAYWLLGQGAKSRIDNKGFDPLACMRVREENLRAQEKCIIGLLHAGCDPLRPVRGETQGFFSYYRDFYTEPTPSEAVLKMLQRLEQAWRNPFSLGLQKSMDGEPHAKGPELGTSKPS